MFAILKNTAKRKETDQKCKNRIYSQIVFKTLWHPKLRARLKNGGPAVGHFWHPQNSALNLRWIWVGRGPTMTLWAPYTPVFFPVWHQNWLSAMGNQSLSLWCDDQFLDSKNQLKKILDKRTFSLKLYLKRYSMSLQIKKNVLFSNTNWQKLQCRKGNFLKQNNKDRKISK